MDISLEDAKKLCEANELDPVNMVDPDMIVNNVLAILQYMGEPEIKLMKKKDPIGYERHMEKKFPEFSVEFLWLFKKVISGEDISPLYTMLQQIKLIKSGKKSFETAENTVVKNLCNKFVKK